MKITVFGLFSSLWPAAMVAASPISASLGPYPVEIDGSLEAGWIQRVDSSAPEHGAEGRLRVRPSIELSPQLRLAASLTGLAGGTAEGSSGPGVYDLGRVLQDLSPSLEIGEAYVDVALPAIDVRAGLQKFAWGKLDALQPNDLLNPEKFYDPVLEDENERKIGIPALSATWHLPAFRGRWAPQDLRFTGVWAPIVVPFYFPDIDERWYPPLARAPEQTNVDGVDVSNETRFRNGRVPDRDLENSGGAARLAGFVGGTDFALYYYDGYDTLPAFDATAMGFVTFQPLAPGCPLPIEACFDARSVVDVFPVFQRIRAAGADLAFDVLGFTVRAEGAFVMSRLYPRAIRDIVAQQELDTTGVLLAPGEEQPVRVTLPPANVRRDGVEWGLGGDTFIGDTFVLLQMHQTLVLDNEVDLLISDEETRFALTVRRGFLDDRLEAEIIGVYGMQGVYGLAHPRLTWDVTDAIDARVGYLMIEGHDDSILGQYRENDEAYMRLRFSF